MRDPVESLKLFMSRNNLKQKDLADGIAVKAPQVSEILNAKKRPSQALRLKIERFTNGFVRADAWLSEEERQHIKAIVPFRPTARASA